MLDVSIEFWIVIGYTILFVVQLVVNFINFLRTGKMSAMIFKPPIESDTVVEENPTVSECVSDSVQTDVQFPVTASFNPEWLPSVSSLRKDICSTYLDEAEFRQLNDIEILIALARLLKG